MYTINGFAYVASKPGKLVQGVKGNRRPKTLFVAETAPLSLVILRRLLSIFRTKTETALRSTPLLR